MSWEKWVLVAFQAYAVFGVVLNIGKPRKPISNGLAAAALVISGGLVALVVFA